MYVIKIYYFFIYFLPGPLMIFAFFFFLFLLLLYINKSIIKDAIKSKRNMDMAWIDYEKAYDSVPQVWILQTLGLRAKYK